MKGLVLLMIVVVMVLEGVEAASTYGSDSYRKDSNFDHSSDDPKEKQQQEAHSGGTDSSSSFSDSFSVTLDQDGNYVLYWKPLERHIEFQVQVRTKGYVGLGFSPSGGMKGADIVMAWVTDGVAYLHDRYSEGYAVPSIDATQDVELLGGYENDTHTVITFVRPWDTCDALQDMKLGSDTVKVIWAYGYEDPADPTSVTRHHHRGTKSLYLQEPHFQMPPPSSDLKSWDMVISNVSVPEGMDTVYWCKLFKFPSEAPKSHIVGHVPILTSTNAEYVHHLVMYSCRLPEGDNDHEANFDRWTTTEDTMGHSCRSASMPPSWHLCTLPLVAWAVGSEGEMLPDHVGFPVGEPGGDSRYFLMEIHYDNPNLKTGIVDTSGIKVYYTDKLRQYDAGTMFFGHTVSPHLIIPPATTFDTTAFCPSSCTDRNVPAGGLHVFQGLLHSHILGTSLSLRQVRNGMELPPIMEDKNYDFNFQQSRVMVDEVTILPGDSLITQCVFNSHRRIPAFGGLRTQDEMCLAFISYYPKIDMSGCLSHKSLDDIVKAAGVDELYEHVDLLKKAYHEFYSDKKNRTGKNSYVEDKVKEGKEEMSMKMLFWLLKAKSPERYANQTLYEILHDARTWDEDGSVAQRLQKVAREGQHVTLCYGDDSYKKDNMVWVGDIPPFTEYQPPEEDSCPQHSKKQ